MSLFAYLFAALTAGWLDLKSRRIPNWLCLVTAIGGLVIAALFAVHYTDLGSNVLHMFISLCGGLLLFRLGIIGGGDAKFYAATAAWFPLAQAGPLFVSVALCGLVLLVVWFAARQFLRTRASRTNKATDGLPYGLAIGAGAMVVLAIRAGA